MMNPQNIDTPSQDQPNDGHSPIFSAGQIKAEPLDFPQNFNVDEHLHLGGDSQSLGLLGRHPNASNEMPGFFNPFKEGNDSSDGFAEHSRENIVSLRTEFIIKDTET